VDEQFFEIDEVYDRYLNTCKSLFKEPIKEKSFSEILTNSVKKLEIEALERANHKLPYAPYGITKKLNGVALNIDVLRGGFLKLRLSPENYLSYEE